LSGRSKQARELGHCEMERLAEALDRGDWLTVVAECQRLHLVAMRAFLSLPAEPAIATPAANERFDVRAAAKHLGISATQTRRYVASGELGYERYGRRLVIPRSALEDFALTHAGGGDG